ncbi:MAG: D-2-hydroxyacid dehydrogenase [candidate division Zixibacteria bacterium]|nr:D-2-hydroxyacid dehydrogenase [candidate division Zixibacteria bacterium]
MPTKQSTRIPVVCALGRFPEFVDWLRQRIDADRYFSRRVEATIVTDKQERDAALPTAEVYTTFRFSPDQFRLCKNLKWLHLGMAGADSALFPAFKRSRVMLTSSVGLHDDTVPNAAMGFLLSFATGLHQGYAQKNAGEWNRKEIVLNRRQLAGQRLVVIGTGRIGQRIGRLARSHGMEVWGVRRSRSLQRLPGFDKIVPTRSLRKALETADFVVLAVPGIPATRDLIGAKELRAMKSTAYLINIARGSVVNEKALITAVTRGHIAGAGLDVFAQEPLPTNHPFYRLPNVAMTPHTSGDTVDYSFRAVEMFLKNLRRYCQGKELFNVVDKKRGY